LVVATAIVITIAVIGVAVVVVVVLLQLLSFYRFCPYFTKREDIFLVSIFSKFYQD